MENDELVVPSGYHFCASCMAKLEEEDAIAIRESAQNQTMEDELLPFFWDDPSCQP
jgi:hypothetical protein